MTVASCCCMLEGTFRSWFAAASVYSVCCKPTVYMHAFVVWQFKPYTSCTSMGAGRCICSCVQLMMPIQQHTAGYTVTAIDPDLMQASKWLTFVFLMKQLHSISTTLPLLQLVLNQKQHCRRTAVFCSLLRCPYNKNILQATSRLDCASCVLAGSDMSCPSCLLLIQRMVMPRQALALFESLPEAEANSLLISTAHLPHQN